MTKSEILHDLKRIAASMAVCIDDDTIKDVKIHLEVLKAELDRLYEDLRNGD